MEVLKNQRVASMAALWSVEITFSLRTRNCQEALAADGVNRAVFVETMSEPNGSHAASFTAVKGEGMYILIQIR